MMLVSLRSENYAGSDSSTKFSAATGNTFFRSLIIVLGVSILYSTVANATSNSIPPSADPARRDERESASPRFDLQETTVLQSNAPELSPNIANVRFTLNSLALNGAQAFDAHEIRTVYSQFLGKEISVGELFGILSRIQQLYLDNGYSLSKITIPEQNILGGDIVFDVVEGYVSAIEIDDKLPDVPMIKDFVTEILGMKPLSVKKLERMLLLLNDRPGIKVSAVL